MDSLTKGTAISRETPAPGTALQGINRLPDEIFIKIFSYLGLCDLSRCLRTCRRWRAILRENKSLWRGRKCCTFEAENIREVLAVAGAMPRFETLSVSYSSRFGIKIAWPVATVLDNRINSLPTWEPYFRCFDTECLVIQYSLRNNFFFHLLWVDRLTLRRIVVLHDTDRPHLLALGTRPFADPVRVASNACDPVQWVRDARRDLFSGRVCHGGGSAEVTAADSEMDGAVCPALEEVKVSNKNIVSGELEELCGLGPVRTLYVRCQLGLGLKFVRRCHKTLEELELWDCYQLPEGAFADLLGLERLRVLRLSDCLVDKKYDDLSFLSPDFIRRRGIFSETGCRHSGTAEVTAADSGMDGEVCPALEEVKVSSYHVWCDQLQEVCGLGPVRTLHVNCGWHRDLKFVRCCHATLEELELSGCYQLPVAAFAELRCLKRLRVLRLSECCIEARSVGRYVADLPCLKTCLVNGSEVLPEISS